jgi:hypothetical protein
MHPYSLDDDERPALYASMALLAVGLTYLTHYAVDMTKIALPLLVDPPSFGVWFALIVYLFDRWLWSVSVFGFRLSKIPVFTGSYEGQLNGSFGGPIRTIPLTLTIDQRWSQLTITGGTEFTAATSNMASVSTRDGELRYEYLNQPKPGYTNRPVVRGVSSFKLVPPKYLSGDYYTKNSNGDIELARVDTVTSRATA